MALVPNFTVKRLIFFRSNGLTFIEPCVQAVQACRNLTSNKRIMHWIFLLFFLQSATAYKVGTQNFVLLQLQAWLSVCTYDMYTFLHISYIRKAYIIYIGLFKNRVPKNRENATKMGQNRA